MRDLPPLSALRTFEAAARRLSFKDAADELHVTPTAVSHQIKQLEEWLGMKLFERATRHVSLTRSGHQLFPAVRDGLDSFEQAIAALRRSQGTKVATLSSTVAFMARQLAPRAGSFRETYPDWTLRLDASNRSVDLDTEADAAIAAAIPDWWLNPCFKTFLRRYVYRDLHRSAWTPCAPRR